MGLTPGESAVVELFEAGRTFAEIAAELGISVRRAARLGRMYDCDPVHDRSRDAALRLGSRELLKRLQAAGGHR
jgi:FixJ family two-component response regulator